ncbi:MAG TPA: cytidine deaminase [Candidatus Cybelea sp.]|jgi:cytidine deaminase|nr:cytidine deaminase [Candidatus Cybelea sp.]
MNEDAALLAAAAAARTNASAPFSRFAVGAALETEDGKVVTGANVENVSFGLTMCAERVALFKALSDGYRTFKTLLIVSEDLKGVLPCGACRQVLWEFCGDIEVLSATPQGVVRRSSMQRLLPNPFDAESLP